MLKKFEQVVSLSDWEVATDTGWKPIKKIMKTIPYRVWEVSFASGKTVKCADTHIFISKARRQVYAKDLELGDCVVSDDGIDFVEDVKEFDYSENMYDLEIGSVDHTYFTNGILSHNTTTVSSILLHKCLFHEDFSIAILANKAEQAREVLSRLQISYENLPWWMQAGVKTWNKGNIHLGNGSKVFTSATGGSGVRGKSANCVAGDARVSVIGKSGMHYVNFEIEKLLQIETKFEKIQTSSGFKSFDGFICNGVRDVIEISIGATDFDVLRCTPDHKLKINGEWIEASSLPHRKLEPQLVYDAVNVADGHEYLTNGVTSHNCVYLDEFAHIENDMEFYMATYPVISSGKDTQIIITSTPNGMNLFYKIWSEAEQKINNYAELEVKYWEHPDRDESWEKIQRENIGERQFNQEYNCCIYYTYIDLKEGDREFSMFIGDAYDKYGYKNNLGLKVKTPNGWKNFDGIRKSEFPVNTVALSDPDKERKTGWLSQYAVGCHFICTPDHLIKEDGKFICAKDSKHLLKYKDGTFDFGKYYVYDLLDVEGGHEYYTDGFISHNCHFIGSTDTLVSPRKLQQLTWKQPIGGDGVYYKVYDEPEDDHLYVITADVSEGVGQDYSVVNVSDITAKPFKQVAVYRSNLIQPLALSEVIYRIGKEYNEATVIVETNSVGKQVAEDLKYTYEYENILHTQTKDSDNDVSSGIRSVPGVKTTKRTKLIGCSTIKGMIESDTYLVQDDETVKELFSFIKKHNSYCAEKGKNDDLVMSLVIFAWFTMQNYFTDLTEINAKGMLKAGLRGINEYEALTLFFDDGISSEIEHARMF